MKNYKAWGIASLFIDDLEKAKNYTYRKTDGGYPPTPLIFEDNPFNDLVSNARHVLEVGCGCGRNLPSVMESCPDARYFGLDPNHSMIEKFWQYNDKANQDWFDRCTLGESLEDVAGYQQKFDFVLSTFVFQHIGYNPPPDIMNVTDITMSLLEHCNPGCIWMLFEHEVEGRWIDRWVQDTGMSLHVLRRNYNKFSEMNDRGKIHNLIITVAP